jgi:GxxExxY protein
MGYGESTTPELERIASAIVDSAFRVHSVLGPGLLESVYEVSLAHELTQRGFKVRRQVGLPVVYDGIRFEAGFVADLVVNDLIIIEVKAVEQLHKVFERQTRTYLKLTNRQLGFLINFNVVLIKDGIKRIIVTPHDAP